jgi:outer membrane protein assembly factor BamA
MEWEIMDLVRESFQHLGYFCAAVEPISALKVGKNEYKIFINVHPGQQYRVAEVKFTGATQLSSDELKSDLHIKPNSLFDGESIRRGIENIQKSYAKKRHWGATAVPVVSVDETDSKVALEIKIQEPD